MKKCVCPNCGAENDKYGTCAFCGGIIMPSSAIPNQGKAEAGKLADYIIPFTETEEQAKTRLINRLIATKNVPLDVFEKMVIIKVAQTYAKAFYLVGRYEAFWNCNRYVNVRHDRDVFGPNGYRREHVYEDEVHYDSGNVAQSFNYLVGRTIYEDNAGFPKTAQRFRTSLLDGIEVRDVEITAFSAWKRIEKPIKNRATDECKRKASYDARDFSNTCSYEETEKPKVVLVPRWDIQFEYEGVVYDCDRLPKKPGTIPCKQTQAIIERAKSASQVFGVNVSKYIRDEARQDQRQQRTGEKLRQKISREQAELDKMQEQHSPNGCLKIGLGVIGVATVAIIIAAMVMDISDFVPVVMLFIILATLVFVVCRYADKWGNKETAEEINRRKNRIEQLSNNLQHK